MIFREAPALATSGVILGLAAGWDLTRLLAVWLFGIGTTDPATFIASAAAIVLVALLAGWLPARRAASIAPTDTLRTEEKSARACSRQ